MLIYLIFLYIFALINTFNTFFTIKKHNTYAYEIETTETFSAACSAGLVAAADGIGRQH